MNLRYASFCLKKIVFFWGRNDKAPPGLFYRLFPSSNPSSPVKKYFLWRLLGFIPMVLLISMLVFAMGASSPIDPVVQNCGSVEEGIPYKIIQACLARERAKFGLTGPAFYFSVKTWAEPDSFPAADRRVRQAQASLLYRSGDWERVATYHLALGRVITQHALGARQRGPAASLHRRALRHALQLPYRYDPLLIQTYLDSISFWQDQIISLPLPAAMSDSLSEGHLHLVQAWKELQSQQQRWRKWLPRLTWHGLDNRYHRWLSGIILRADFGTSYASDRRPVREFLGNSWGITLRLSLISFLLTYLLAIPLGLWMARHAGRRRDRWAGATLFGLNAMPEFWVAGMLMLLFANPDLLDWFYSSVNTGGTGFLETLRRYTLPIIAYVYGGLAYLSRTLRASLLDVIDLDYIRTARAKGLNERQVWLRHALRTSLLPLITVVVGIFPALIGGSVVIERMFQINGLGRKIFEATLSDNLPVIMAVFTLSGLLSMLGYWVADLLYAWAFPRIRFGDQKD